MTRQPDAQEANVIRNVVVGRLRDPADEQARRIVAGGIAGILGLDLPGLTRPTGGADAGLRAGGWDFAIVNDFADADSYRRYDLDDEHNRHRSMIAAQCSDIARVQFEVG